MMSHCVWTCYSMPLNISIHSLPITLVYNLLLIYSFVEKKTQQKLLWWYWMHLNLPSQWRTCGLAMPSPEYPSEGEKRDLLTSQYSWFSVEIDLPYRVISDISDNKCLNFGLKWQQCIGLVWITCVHIRGTNIWERRKEWRVWEW